MSLSHRRKVAVRKALATLRRLDEESNFDDPMTEHYGAQEFVNQSFRDAVRRATRKAGFSDPNSLERFALKHRLIPLVVLVGEPPEREWGINPDLLDLINS